ncbi:MAG: cytochrome c [Bdellovibrionaceae bacterium]|nr:cytochrome c [Pseudobdellovibrionaceae bacterium]
MMSKSAARRFFLLGTAACSVAFVLLTVDTIKRVPAQTNQHQLTASAIRGKHLWDSKNCMGCHTILGEGAYYAPELTKVYERRGEVFIRAILKDPEAMYPGERKMVNYRLSEQEITDLVAFLKWIGEMDLNGFPPKPDIRSAIASPIKSGTAGSETTSAADVNVAAKPAVFDQMCTACHSVQGVGGAIGPALDGVGARRDSGFLSTWLKDPLSLKPDSRMPKLPLSESQVSELVVFLSGLKAEVAK